MRAIPWHPSNHRPLWAGSEHPASSFICDIDQTNPGPGRLWTRCSLGTFPIVDVCGGRLFSRSFLLVSISCLFSLPFDWLGEVSHIHFCPWFLEQDFAKTPSSILPPTMHPLPLSQHPTSLPRTRSSIVSESQPLWETSCSCPRYKTLGQIHFIRSVWENTPVAVHYFRLLKMNDPHHALTSVFN